MNVTFGLVAAWLAFCLASVGVKGRGYDLSTAGQSTLQQASWGVTLVQMLRGQWPYAVPSEYLPIPGSTGSQQYPGGPPEAPVPAGPGIHNNPGNVYPNVPSTPASGLPQAGSVYL